MLGIDCIGEREGADGEVGRAQCPSPSHGDEGERVSWPSIRLVLWMIEIVKIVKIVTIVQIGKIVKFVEYFPFSMWKQPKIIACYVKQSM